MTMDLHKGHSVATAGLAAITGVGVALGFTVFDSTTSLTSTSLLILITVISLAVSPFLAGWSSPELKHALFFPIGVLGSLSIASAIYGPLSSDSEPVGFVFVLTFIYGGGASVAFCAAWIARQYLRRFCGLGVPVSHLAIASLVMVCLSVVLTVLYFGFAAIPDPSGLIGVVAGTAIIWSDRHRGRWSSLGLGLSLLYLGASIGTPVYLGISVVTGLVYLATGYGLVALALVGLAIWNILRWRQDRERYVLGDS